MGKVLYALIEAQGSCELHRDCRRLERIGASACAFCREWLWTYNNNRPDMGLGGITPAQKLKQQLAA